MCRSAFLAECCNNGCIISEQVQKYVNHGICGVILRFKKAQSMERRTQCHKIWNIQSAISFFDGSHVVKA